MRSAAAANRRASKIEWLDKTGHESRTMAEYLRGDRNGRGGCEQTFYVDQSRARVRSDYSEATWRPPSCAIIRMSWLHDVMAAYGQARYKIPQSPEGLSERFGGSRAAAEMNRLAANETGPGRLTSTCRDRLLLSRCRAAPLLEKNYQLPQSSGRVWAAWEEAQEFRAGPVPAQPGEAYCIVIPPRPMSRTLLQQEACPKPSDTLKDAAVPRLEGQCAAATCCGKGPGPGTDHAGIATQIVVESQLMERQEAARRSGRGRNRRPGVVQWKASPAQS